MPWRKSLVRGLVFSVLAGLAGAGWLYQRVTSPAVVRQQVIANLESHFFATHVSVESAGLRLLGGISIRELRLTRIQDPQQIELLYVPAGIIYHDKEQLLDGKLAIRKVEMLRPRIRLIRERDGRWNTAELLGPTDLNETIPTIVIRNGTILLEDRLAAPEAAPIEIKDVNLAIINDPKARLVIQARGVSDLLGTLQARMLLDRASLAATVNLDMPTIPIGPPLVQRLAAYCPRFGDNARSFTGLAHLEMEASYHPSDQPFWTHELSCQLTQGKLEHPQLPLPLDNIKATIRCSEGGLRVEKLSARAGPAQVEAQASFHALKPDADWEGELKATHVPVAADLFAHMPEGLQEINQDYAPTGTADVSLHIARQAGLWHRHSVITTSDARACYDKFPYSLDKVHGRIEEECDERSHVKLVTLDLVGAGAAARPVHVKGTIKGGGSAVDVHVDIWGEDIPLDEKLQAALAPPHQKISQSFQPSGKADFVMQVRRQPGESFANHINIRFHDAAIRYDVFPYPLENVSGVLDILPDHWEFHDFHGAHKGGEFRTWGRSQPVPGDRDRISMTIQVSNLLLDEELEAALAPKLRAAWKAMAPGGRLNVEALIDQLPDRPEDIAVTVTTRGCTLRPTFFPYVLTGVTGTVRYAKGKVELEKLAARHGGSLVTLAKGQVYLKPAGGFWARMTNIQGNPVILDADLIAALPPALKKVGSVLQQGTPLGLATELIIDMPSEPNMPPDIFWDGGVAFQDTTLQAGIEVQNVRGQAWCQGRHDGHQLQGVKGNILLDQAVLYKQPFREVHSHFIVAPDAPEVLRLPDLKARIFGGDIGGELRIEFGPTLHYKVNLTALEVKLEDFGKHNLGANGQWKGLASGRLYLRGSGSDIHGLEGQGYLDVPQGQMYDLPLLLDLVKMLGLRAPDRTAFEEAHAHFNIKGPRVTVDRLDLDGNAISLSGQGELNLDGSDIQLDFYAVWGRIKQVLPVMFRDIPPALGKQLLKIKMRGTVNDVRVSKEPVPALVEPVENILRRLAGRQEAQPDKGDKPVLPLAAGK